MQVIPDDTGLKLLEKRFKFGEDLIADLSTLGAVGASAQLVLAHQQEVVLLYVFTMSRPMALKCCTGKEYRILVTAQ